VRNPRVAGGGCADFCDTPKMSIVGYARVSTGHQSLDQQRDALAAAGCERVFSDKLSGVREDRPGLAALPDYVRSGDTVVVIALDRLGRSLSGVIRTVETLTEAGVLLRSLRGHRLLHPHGTDARWHLRCPGRLRT